MHKVLWLDDQCDHEEMKQFVIEAENKGFYLDGYTSSEEGFEVLVKNIEEFDIILLDGLFYEKKDQESGTEDESGIGMAIAKINELKIQKIFPWFVLSGKDSFTKGENPFLKANRARCYDKTNPSDILNLFEEMKSAAENQPDVQLKNKYKTLLEICSESHLGSKQYSRLFSLIKYVENSEIISNSEDMLNPLRKIIEALFWRLGELGVIPKDILSDIGSINKSSLFLANRHYDYKHKTEFIHPLVSENIHRLLNILQDASHGEGELKLKVDEYIKDRGSDYLYRSNIYLLFDILHWFKDFIDNHNNLELNKELWLTKKEFKGKHEKESFLGDPVFGMVTRLSAEKGHAYLRPDTINKSFFIDSDMVNEFNLKNGMRIKAELKTISKSGKDEVQVKRIIEVIAT